MSAFTVVSILSADSAPSGAAKRVTFTATGTASYDTAGSVLNLATSGVLGINGFSAVHGVKLVGVAAAASDRYVCTYVRAAAGAPATGKLKVRDADDATAMIEVSSTTDLSALTFVFEAVGV
jgi:hypothetical protein